MKISEVSQILAAIIIFAAIASFSFILQGSFQLIPGIILSCAIIIIVSVAAKKLMAGWLDADVEHEIWQFSRYGLRASHHLERPIPAGIILPVFISIFTLGAAIVPIFLTYETSTLKRRAAKRFGNYSYTEMTDWHMSLIGAAGIIAALILAAVFYFLPYKLEYFAILASFYAFFNLIPLSKIDGAQIFYGSRVLWTVLALISAIFVIYSSLIAFHLI